MTDEEARIHLEKLRQAPKKVKPAAEEEEMVPSGVSVRRLVSEVNCTPTRAHGSTDPVGLQCYVPGVDREGSKVGRTITPRDVVIDAPSRVTFIGESVRIALKEETECVVGKFQDRERNVSGFGLYCARGIETPAEVETAEPGEVETAPEGGIAEFRRKRQEFIERTRRLYGGE